MMQSWVDCAYEAVIYQTSQLRLADDQLLLPLFLL
jgi:hypothetical protein